MLHTRAKIKKQPPRSDAGSATAGPTPIACNRPKHICICRRCGVFRAIFECCVPHWQHHVGSDFVAILIPLCADCAHVSRVAPCPPLVPRAPPFAVPQTTGRVRASQVTSGHTESQQQQVTTGHIGSYAGYKCRPGHNPTKHTPTPYIGTAGVMHRPKHSGLPCAWIPWIGLP